MFPNKFDKKTSILKPKVHSPSKLIHISQTSTLDGQESTNSTISINNANFEKLSKEVGYVRARHNLRQVSVNSHQNQINAADKSAIADMRPRRVRLFREISATSGAPVSQSVIEKIASFSKSRNPVSMESAQLVKSASAAELIPNPNPKKGSAADREKAMRENDIQAALNRSLITDALEIPQMGLDSLPQGLGDTLFLQTAHLRKLSCQRNNMTSLLPYEMPQLSCFHFRYVQEMNLSGNRIRELPAEFSLFKSLTSLDLSGNQLSRLPDRLNLLTALTTLNLAQNNFSDIPTELAFLSSLHTLNLSKNIFQTIPRCVAKLRHLKSFDCSFNFLNQPGIHPILLRHEDMWHKFTHPETGHVSYINLFTRERLADTSKYDGRAMKALSYLHTFQPLNSMYYEKRKMWLSICQVNEWDPVLDGVTGYVYFVNRVSGDTQWDVPSAMDQWSNLSELTNLNLSNNTIRILPSSFGDLVALQRLNIERNRIGALPHSFSRLQKLKKLFCHENALHALPNGLTACASLEELSLQDNLIEKLPELGLLARLTKLFVTHNCIKMLPSSLGFSTTLKELHVHENPLDDPPYEETEKGLAHLQWLLRQRQHVQDRGMPPAMQYRAMGVGEEVNMIYPEYLTTLTRLIEAGKELSTLNLQLMGLRGIPQEILGMSTLKELRLDVNMNLGQSLNFTDQLSGLRALSLRACNLTVLPNSITILRKLKVLVLQQNLLPYLPENFAKLGNIRELDLSRNKLYTLPPNLKNMRYLETFTVEGNYLETLPLDIGTLTSLKILNASKNRIQVVPQQISDLVNLRHLNLERNRLYELPDGIKYLSLTELRVGYNRIEFLEEDFFDANLGVSLEQLSLVENNLVELPLSISSLRSLEVEQPLPGQDVGSAGLKAISAGAAGTDDAVTTALVEKGGKSTGEGGIVRSNGLLKQETIRHCRVDFDSNPLISPPTELRIKGLRLVQKYLRIRKVRIDELAELLDENNFRFLVENMTPVAHEVLDDDGSSFLYPEDMLKFDRAVDRFVNGPFYSYSASAEEMASKLCLLRDEREAYIYMLILNALVDAIETVREDIRFGAAVLTVTKRKWGRSKDFCRCLAVSEESIFVDTPPNSVHKEGRPALFGYIQNLVPALPFTFTPEMLRNAIQFFEGPYGQVAAIEQYTFKECDCVDKNLRQLDHNPCMKTAVVITRKIFTRDEASRREVEESLTLEKFEEIDLSINLWSKSRHGSDCISDLVLERRKRLLQDIALRSEVLATEELKLSRCKSEMEKLQRRKQLFEQGMPFEVHLIKGATEAIKLTIIADNKIQNQNNRIMVLKETLQELRTKKQLDDDDMKSIACDELVQKYCCLAETELLKKNRLDAMTKQLRRPWDGVDGEAFETWVSTVGKGLVAKADDDADDHLKALVEAMQKSHGDLVSVYETESVASNPNPDDPHLHAITELEFDWEGCENMEQYTSPMWSIYRATHESAFDRIKRLALSHSGNGEPSKT